MNETNQVQALQKKTALVMALKTQGGQAIVDQLASTLAKFLDALIVKAGKDEDLIQKLYEVRGAAAMLGELGYDMRSVIDLAARNAVKQQMHLTKPPTIRRDDDERSTEGEEEDGQ